FRATYTSIAPPDFVRLVLFPIFCGRNGPVDWKARADAECPRGEDPALLRAEHVKLCAIDAAVGATSESTWGRVHSHGRSRCTAYAAFDAAIASAGIPTED